MRRDQVLWDERSPQGSEPQGVPSSKEEGTKGQPWVAGAYRIFTKVFNATTYTLEQEKRFKALLNRTSEDIALEAIDLMFQEGVRYPTGKELREAIERTRTRTMMQEPLERPAGPWITFADWYALQDDAMKARVKRAFPSLKIFAEEHAP